MLRSKKIGTGALIGAALIAAAAGQAGAQPTCGGSRGPDVIVGVLTGPANYGTTGGLDALALGTTSCNMGTETLKWDAFPANTHPAIAGNLYKFKAVNGSGRFEQIGLSWLKHGFLALANSDCCTCQNPGTGTRLGIGCSDPYSASRNGGQSGLGPRWQVNAHTGVFPTGGVANPGAISGNTAKRIEVLLTDLEVSSAAVKYYGESQYISPDDAANNNQNNNSSYSAMNCTGGPSDYSFAFISSTQRGLAAIRAWPTAETGVTLTDVQVPNDGLFVVGSKATSLGGGVFHYEYAVYNMNSDRNGGSFSVPLPVGINATNIGFHGVTYRNGDATGNTSGGTGVNFANTTWTVTVSGGTITWNTEAQATNNLANAIRWGTLYNFRFDAPIAPTTGDVTLGLWKSGTPAVVTGAAQIPACGTAVAITSQPSAAATCPTGSAVFTTTATGSNPVYQWQRQTAPNTFVTLADGSTSSWDGGGVGVGGIVTGATTGTLRIAADTANGRRLTSAHSINLRCVVSNLCGAEPSHTAQMSVCRADFNCSGQTDFFDYLDFVGPFGNNDPSADFNGDGEVNFFDYLDFVAALDAGC